MADSAKQARPSSPTAGPAAGKDVARPGTTPATATSKPVIIGHTSQVDPMVSATVPADASEEKPSTESPTTQTAPPVSGTGSSKPKLTPSADAMEAVAAADIVDTETESTDAETEKSEEVNQTRLQEVIESGEYHVSIGQKNAKSNAGTFFATVTIILILGIIALYILADLKIIDPGINLPFHIFKQ